MYFDTWIFKTLKKIHNIIKKIESLIRSILTPRSSESFPQNRDANSYTYIESSRQSTSTTNVINSVAVCVRRNASGVKWNSSPPQLEDHLLRALIRSTSWECWWQLLRMSCPPRCSSCCVFDRDQTIAADELGSEFQMSWDSWSGCGLESMLFVCGWFQFCSS